MQQRPLSIEVTVDGSPDQVEPLVREALREEGFGVLTEIDAQAVLKDRLGVEMPAYKILGACNPEFAHQALDLWRGFGVLLPCNVVIYAAGSHTVVAAFDPTTISEVRDSPRLLPLARQVRARLERALASLEDPVRTPSA